MTVRTIYEVFYSWCNWQQLQVSLKGHLSHHLLEKSHNLDIFPNYASSECFHCFWVMLLGSEPVLAVSLSLRGSLHKKGAEKWRLNQGFVQWFVMVNVEALPSLRALPMCSVNSLPSVEKPTVVRIRWCSYTWVTCSGLSPELFWVWKLLRIHAPNVLVDSCWWENLLLTPVYVPVLIKSHHSVFLRVKSWIQDNTVVTARMEEGWGAAYRENTWQWKHFWLIWKGIDSQRTGECVCFHGGLTVGLMTVFLFELQPKLKGGLFTNGLPPWPERFGSLQPLLPVIQF